jgi:NAD(P)-dependent dehydrogenase (short-subunit alcohol dehydrogenase family)
VSTVKQATRLGGVLVTGASSGIGFACVSRLAAQGCTVFAGVRTPEDHRRLAQMAGVTPVVLDVTSARDVESARAAVERSLDGRELVGVVNNAGVMVTGPLEVVPVAALRRQLEVNVVGALAVIQAFLPLLERSTGRIVNIGSTSGRIAGAFAGPYCAAKFAMEAMTAVWREELRSSGISVHSVDPGVVATPLWEKAAAGERALAETLDNSPRRRYDKPLARRQALLQRLGRGGAAPDAVCDAVVHALLSPRPKRRYVVGRDAQIRVAVARVMPQRLWFWLGRRSS